MQRFVAGHLPSTWRPRRVASAAAGVDAGAMAALHPFAAMGGWGLRSASTAVTVPDAGPATLSFVAKLVAKSGAVDKATVTRLIPRRMSDSLAARHGGDLAALVAASGKPFGLAMNAEGTKIISNGSPATAASTAAKPAAKPAAPPASKPPPTPPLPATPATGHAAAAAGSGTIAAPKLPSLPGTGRTARSSGMPGGAGIPEQFNPGLRTWKSPAEVAETLMEYVPTFWIKARHVHNALPHEIKELYNDKMRLNQFIRKFQFYFDTKMMADGPYLKVRDTCNHAKKGFADDRYASSLLHEDGAGAGHGAGGSHNRFAPAGRDTTLEGRIRALVGKEWAQLADVEAKLPADVQTMKDYDKKAGLWPVIDGFPQYFQLVDGRVRARPIGVAPNALDERTVETSPEPELFRRLYALVPADSTDGIPTATLFASLSAEDKALIKQKHRSFPRFLRMHGRVISVTKDNMTVRAFAEAPLPDDVVSAEDGFAGGEMLGAEPTGDIVGKRLPGATSFDASAVENGIKDLFEALPLLQSVPLDDATFMLAASVRGTLATTDLAAELREYPSYFSLWEFPDDPSIVVVQRANLDTPDIPADEIVSTVHQLIPQGGIDAERLMRKVPLRLQRYFYRHGLLLTLKGMGQHFVVVGQKVLAIGE